MQSEFEIVNWIRARSAQLPSEVLRSIGDDCAVISQAAGKDILVSKDLLMEDAHFRRDWTNPVFLGTKTLAVNLSDIAAMGGRPLCCLLGIGLPKDLSPRFRDRFLSGLLQAAERWNCPLIGGDISSSRSVAVSVTVLGTVEREAEIARSGARAGDQLVLVGALGLAESGLQLLESGKYPEISRIEDDGQLGSIVANPFDLLCLKAHLLPEPLLEVGQWLSDHDLANSLIDVSDGLASDLLHLAKESQLRAFLDLEAVELSQAYLGVTIEPRVLLNGGEDYALLFSASQSQMDRLSESYPETFPTYSVVGMLQAGAPEISVRRGEHLERYEPEGFDHFK
jgi:thiamine-monophosphate kinase